MTNKQPVENRLKPFLIKERTRLMILASQEGLTFADIARIFKVDKSIVTRAISDSIEVYKMNVSSQ